MANIISFLNVIKNAVYGKDMRLALYDVIERVNDDVETRLKCSGGSMTGDITMNTNKVTTTSVPTLDIDCTNKKYVDGEIVSATSNFKKELNNISNTLNEELDAEYSDLNKKIDETSATLNERFDTEYSDLDTRIDDVSSSITVHDSDISELKNSCSSMTRCADIIIAAYDANDGWKSCADYVCDGKADQVEINNAIKELKKSDKLNGKILLSTGTFYLSNQITVPNTLEVALTLEGMGDSTVICTAARMPSTNVDSDSGVIYIAGYNENVKLTVKDICFCNNYNLCYGITEFLSKRIEFFNITLKSAYSVPSSLGYTARSYTYSDDPGYLWGGASNDYVGDMIHISNCRVLTDKNQSIYIGSGMVIDGLYLHSASTVVVSGDDNIVNIISDNNTYDNITINVNGNRNRVIQNPYININNTGTDNIIA